MEQGYCGRYTLYERDKEIQVSPHAQLDGASLLWRQDRIPYLWCLFDCKNSSQMALSNMPILASHSTVKDTRWRLLLSMLSLPKPPSQGK